MNGIKSRMCWLLDRLKANSSNSSQKLLIFCCGIPALKNIQTTSTGYTWVLSDNVSPFGWSCLLYLCEASTMCHAFLPSGDPLMIYVSLIGHDSWPRSFSLKVALCTLCRTVCLQTRRLSSANSLTRSWGDTDFSLVQAEPPFELFWPTDGGFIDTFLFLANSDGTGNDTTLLSLTWP